MIERGRITRVQGRKVFVEVPKLGLGVEFGPCDVAWQSDFTLPSDQAAGGDSTSHSHPVGDGATGSASVPHRHALPGLVVGAKVVVATIHNVPDDVVVLGIIG